MFDFYGGDDGEDDDHTHYERDPRKISSQQPINLAKILSKNKKKKTSFYDLFFSLSIHFIIKIRFVILYF